MGMSDEDFFHSSLQKVTKMIEIFSDEKQLEASQLNNTEYNPKYFRQEQEIVDIKSMNEIPGW